MYGEAYLEPSRTSMVELLCENHKKRFIVDVWLGSKYVSGVNFTAKKVTECQYLFNIVKVNFRNLSLIFLFFELIKSMLVLMKKL